MNITYNNVPSATSFVTFSDIPNILMIEDDTVGLYTLVRLRVVGSGWNTAVTSDNQFTLTLLGESISNVTEPSNATNKNFYITSNNYSTAVSMCKALRNCPTLVAKFNIYMSLDEEATVVLKSREVGRVFVDFSTELQMSDGMSDYVNYSAVWGSDSSPLWNSKINVDIYSDGNYVTSLEKNFYRKKCGIDVGAVLGTIAERGKTIPYDMYMSYTNASGITTSLGTISGNTVSQGYLVNQGFKYLPLGTLTNGFIVAQNYSRGSSKTWDNNSVLYLYGYTIPLSWYSKTLTSLTVTIEYLNSAYSVQNTDTVTVSDDENGWLHNVTVNLTPNKLRNAFYIRLKLNNGNIAFATIGYNVIKPIRMTEYYQRIYFRNSYGGVSFFDFTGQKSETRDLEVTTYEKNIYDFYTQDKNEQTMIYNNDVDYSVTLKSHLIEKDGTYIFNDLIQSQEVWTMVNGETYGIIIDSVSVEEDNRNDIYTATVKYRYSQKTSL